MRRVHCLILISALALVGSPGCSTHSKSTKTVSVEQPATTDESANNARVVEKSTTTETHTESSTKSGGVLSSTVNLVGKTIALPFRAVGGLIDLVF